MPEDYAIVYLRPDGWWSAGEGWESIEAARADAQKHEWNGRAWGIVHTDSLVDIEGDMRLPLDHPGPIEAVEGSFHD